MISFPYFSVVIPAYNAEKYIEQTLNSVYRQSFVDYEIVVVNDGSTDQTAEILAAQRDSRLRVFYQENQGVSAARNRGIKEARGKYIAFLDGDDAWVRNHLELAFSFFEKHPEYIWYVTMPKLVKTIDDSALVPSASLQGEYQAVNWFLEISHQGTCSSCVILREVIASGAFFPNGVRIYEDAMAYSSLAHKYPMIGLYTGTTALYRRWEHSAYHSFHRRGCRACDTSDVFQEFLRRLTAGQCSEAEKLYYKKATMSEWRLRIRGSSILPWVPAMRKHKLLVGRAMVKFLVAFAWFNNFVCRIGSILLRVRCSAYERKMARAAAKCRIRFK